MVERGLGRMMVEFSIKLNRENPAFLCMVMKSYLTKPISLFYFDFQMKMAYATDLSLLKIFFTKELVLIYHLVCNYNLLMSNSHKQYFKLLYYFYIKD